MDVNAIYDTYGAGRASPEAIHVFLQHTYHAGTMSIPMCVLLVGDGSYDFKNYSGGGVQNLIPPTLPMSITAGISLRIRIITPLTKSPRLLR